MRTTFLPLLLLLAIPLALYMHKNGITVENMASLLFWIWIVFFILSFVLTGIFVETGKMKRILPVCVGFFAVNFLAWLFAKYLIVFG